ncbi:MAG: PAS domain S-box protein [Acidobacteriaceae bacterium]|nr:PAS domain S-box protein [Acidobacteriaceae bacterium]
MREETALLRKELFDAFVSQLSDFVVVFASPAGTFTSWHPGVQQYFGYSREEFVGQSVEILLPPADRLRGDAARELEDAARTGKASDTRWLVTKGGEEILVEGVTLALRDESGALEGFGKLLVDVTERKLSEDNLKAVARALDQSTVIVRQWDGTIEHWTAGCERLYGWTAEEAIGKPVQELLHTVYPTSLDDIQTQLLATGTWNGELEHVRSDGSRVYVSTHWVLLADRDSEPSSVIETHSDITARLEIQRELENVNLRLKAMALELERSNQELEEFARIASHDLSAPITSTRWLVDLVRSRNAAQLDESGRKCLEQITDNLSRMTDLVEAVLTHARVGTTAIGTSETTQAERALAISIENLTKDISVSGAGIEKGSLPAVHVNGQALTQLFQNLLSNAIKYRRAGVQPSVFVNAEWRNGEWLFSVRDNGIGIEPEWHQRIFQAMQRRHGVDVAGSGIGLATCKKIVTRVGGSIWVESVPGEGSTFFFTLPGPKPQNQTDQVCNAC